ncbi:MAG: alpha/beta fold hydrolase [Deltaproteobacteria bacterium]|nr:alpha/beta fold hydrolase [Deltaproteobacteria bacterium]
MSHFILFLFVLALTSVSTADVEPAGFDERESVILLHGLGRTPRSMEPLAEYLSGRGFRVFNLGYPSTTGTPDQLVALLREEVDECCADSPVVHFVGHSLGGILVRGYLAEDPRSNVGRLVMLGPPNRGSELVDRLSDSHLFRWALGPTAQQLGTSSESLPNQLPEPSIEFGVIAGTETVNPIGSVVLPEADDGMVSVARTKLDGMTDFLLVPSSHAFIMRSPEVSRQVDHFLRLGRFDHLQRGE